MVDKLHAMGFKVMLWVCPFVSPDSREFRYLAEEGMLLLDPQKEQEVLWSNTKNKAAIIRWPGVVPAGVAHDELTTAMDLLPTLARWAGTSVPDGVVIDGHESKPFVLANMVYQGTALGPILWLVYFRDISEPIAAADCLPRKFADDLSATRLLASALPKWNDQGWHASSPSRGSRPG